MLLASARNIRKQRLVAAAENSAPARRARAVEALKGCDADATPAVAEAAAALAENGERVHASALQCTAGWLAAAASVETKRGVAALEIPALTRARIAVVFYDGRKSAGPKPVRLAEVLVEDLSIETRWARVSDLVALAGDAAAAAAEAAGDTALAKAMAGTKVIAALARR